MKRLWSIHWLHTSEANSTSEAEEFNEEMKGNSNGCTQTRTKSYKSLLIRWTSPWVLVQAACPFRLGGLSSFRFCRLAIFGKEGFTVVIRRTKNVSPEVLANLANLKLFTNALGALDGRISRRTLSSPQRTKLWTGRPSAWSLEICSRLRDDAWFPWLLLSLFTKTYHNHLNLLHWQKITENVIV